VFDRNQAEQGGASGSSPQLLGSGSQFITGLIHIHNYLICDTQLLGSGSQHWFFVIGSSYFTTTRSGPMDGS
jgi:hypothetical protein